MVANWMNFFKQIIFKQIKLCKHKKNRTGIFIWLGLETALYLLFLCLDFMGNRNVSNVVKFVSILICFLGFSLFYRREKEKRESWILLALLFSVFADVFLLFTPFFLPGVISFLVVQSFLMIYLAQIHNVSLNRQIGIRVGLALVILGLLFLGDFLVDALLIAVCFYITAFACNVVLGIYGAEKKKVIGMDFILMLGLILFFLCDINVGIYNLSLYWENESGMLSFLTDVSSFAMWFFYLPGQVLIALSGMLRRGW